MPNEIDTVILIAIPVLLSVAVIILMFIKKGTIHIQQEIHRLLQTEFREIREETARTAKDLREEVAANQRRSTDSMIKAIAEIGKIQTDQLNLVSKRIRELIGSNESSMERLRNTVDSQLRLLHEKNEKKLEQMRQTVDEKLHHTLETRLGESFRLVSKQLEAVQRGLGEMQNLAAGVGDLKRVLTNVKARGVWGEIQLGTLLEDVLTPDQYKKNVRVRPNSSESVEYAIRLPGSEDNPGSCVWLPIDSKFPQEDYLRLLDSVEAGDTEMIQKATAGIIRAIDLFAKDIKEKYIFPPFTTDFAIMFLPTEGLYAEVLRQPGQVEKMQQKYRVVISGPTTLCAILNSLRMGFQTLALERRSGEVWDVLAAVKTEFGKFSDILKKVKRQLNAASNTIDQTAVRTRVMERKLKQVETLPTESTAAILGIDNKDSIEISEEE